MEIANLRAIDPNWDDVLDERSCYVLLRDNARKKFFIICKECGRVIEPRELHPGCLQCLPENSVPTVPIDLLNKYKLFKLLERI